MEPNFIKIALRKGRGDGGGKKPNMEMQIYWDEKSALLNVHSLLLIFTNLCMSVDKDSGKLFKLLEKLTFLIFQI